MRLFSCLLFLVNVSNFLYGQCDRSKRTPATADGVCDTSAWVLAFEDNFDGDALDLGKWQNQPHSQGPLQGAGNLEYTSLDNSSVSNGMLHVTIKKETVERRAVNWHPDDKLLGDSLPNLRTYNYTSSVLWTKEQFSHGRFEIRCRIPKGKGFWPAFWTFGGDNGVWNEIDVFEFGNVYGPKFLGLGGKYKPDKAVSRHRTNAHYDFDKDGGHDNCPKHKDITDFSIGLHTFELTWTPFIMEWKVDGVTVRKKYKYTKCWGLKKVGCDDYKANKKYKIDKAFPMEQMNIIVGAGIRSGHNAPDSIYTTFPGTMEVDYIRYYRRASQ